MVPEIELRIISILRKKQNYFKYNAILHHSFFQTEETKQLYNLIDEYFQIKNKTKLTRADLRILVYQKIKNPDLNKACLEAVGFLKKYKPKDNEVIEEAIKDFSKRHYAKQAILSGLEALDQNTPDFSAVQEHLGKALTISTDLKYMRYFEEDREIDIEESGRGQIFTGIPKLDEALGGGVGAGELVVVLAPPERGKTLAMINLGTAALYQGKKVGFLTLELSERKLSRRFDLRISGRTTEILKKNPGRIKQPLALLRKTGCDLVIKDYSAEDPKLEDIKSFIVNYQNRMCQKFDMIIVDYADLIRPSKIHKNERFGIKEVYTNLRRMANEFQIPIVTASQANRKSVNKLIVSMEDFAEDFQKAAIADVIIAICQTPEELEDDLCRLYIAKNRSTGKHAYFRLTMKPSIMFLGEERNQRKTIADKI